VAARAAPLLLAGAGEQENGIARLELGSARREPRRLEVGTADREQREPALVVERHVPHVARAPVESGELDAGRAQHQVVRGQHVVSRDRDARAHPLLAQDRSRRMLRGDLGAQVHDRGRGDARDENGGVRDRLRGIRL
jgi:hypothetical protein